MEPTFIKIWKLLGARLLHLLELGALNSDSKDAYKKIRLFNAICFLWYLVGLLFITLDAQQFSEFYKDIALHITIMMLVLLGQILHHRGLKTAGHIILIICLIIGDLLFCNFVRPGRLLEYYFLIPPFFGLVFIDNRKLNLFILLVSYLSFSIPDLILNHYGNVYLLNPGNTLLFAINFIIVNYFKTLNRANEHRLMVKSNELEEINRFRSQFFINVSHELRTPLTLIKGNNDRIQQNLIGEVNRNINQATEIVNDQVEKIKGIVDDIMDLSKLESNLLELNKQELNIWELIVRAYESFQLQFSKKGVELEIKSNEKYIAVEADVLYLERVMNNLLSNALKYTPSGKKVEIVVTIQEDKVFFEIKDQGIGIGDREVNKIFDRFYQVDNQINRSGGSGIGLAFCKEIILLHDGNVQVQSSINSGTSFIVSLPIANVSSPPATVENSIVDFRQSLKGSFELNFEEQSYKILIVEDHLEMRHFIKEIFNGFQCYEANDGLEALEILKINKVNLVVTDWMMPGMNGYSLFQKLKESEPGLPVLMLTAKADNTTKLELLKLGLNDFLQKPFDSKELIFRAKNLINNSEQRLKYRYENEIESNDKELALLERIKSQIIDNPRSINNSEDIIAQFYVSKSTLYRTIKAETGLGIGNFIKEIKLQMAKRYIEQKRFQTIKELSYTLGYKRPGYFQEIYKERFSV